MVLLPLLGTVLFVLLYVLASRLYPGGSQVDSTSRGFSWVNNYWCNLLNDKAINGQSNPAMPVAIAGMFVLSASLIIFWFVFPKILGVSKPVKLMIQVSGTLAMITACFLFTHFSHDLIINLASSFGLVAMAGIYIGLYKMKWLWLLAFGFLNILLVAANNYVYYTEGMIIYLPVIQKVTFAVFLIWVCCIDVQLFNLASRVRYQQDTAHLT